MVRKKEMEKQKSYGFFQEKSWGSELKKRYRSRFRFDGILLLIQFGVLMDES